MKPYQCKTCPETNPANFYPTQKSCCKKCTIARTLKQRHSRTSHKQPKPYLCVACGETDVTLFYATNKSRCKSCIIDTNKPSGNSRDRKRKPHLCKHCGETNPALFYVSQKHQCKACAIIVTNAWQDDNILRFRWVSARARAKKKGLEFSVTEQDIQDMWHKQEGLCYYTGQPMVLSRDDSNVGPSTQSVSLDRLDSTKGYVEGNVVLCCAAVNIMKSNIDLTTFKEMVTLLAQRIHRF